MKPNQDAYGGIRGDGFRMVIYLFVFAGRVRGNTERNKRRNSGFDIDMVD